MSSADSGGWRSNPIVAVVAMLIALLAFVFVFKACRGNATPTGPDIGYVCISCDTTWEQPRTIGAACPNCSEPGALPVDAQCRGCKHEFVAWETRQIGVGQFEHRVRGGEWSGLSPATLTCPKCKRQGAFDERGLFFTPGAVSGSETVEE